MIVLEKKKNIAQEYNLYWPVYQNIENELLSMTNYIRFDDKQLDVYSDKLLELLLRTWVEIEAISKELYLNNGGKVIKPESKMYFDKVCLKHLEEKWCLSEKIVQIVNTNMYFSQDNLILCPLEKAYEFGDTASEWKQAYQSIKHNRSQNYSQGNLKNCIKSLAALYLLNIYYKNESIKLKNNFEVNNFDLTQGSKIFSIKTYVNHDFENIVPVEKNATYVINYTDDFIVKLKKCNFDVNKIYFEYVLKDLMFIKEMQKNDMTIEEIAEEVKAMGIENIINIIGTSNHVKYMKNAVQKSNIHDLLSKSNYVAYLNKENK